MSNQKSTKRAFLGALLSIVLCLAMLIGATFAWFTDTKSTSVNKIEAGNLKVELQMKENGKWVDAKGKMLNWLKSADAQPNEATLFEPGCTYTLPEIRVVNNGNLALKYEIRITGVQGNAKLLKALEFSVNGTAFSDAPGSYTGTLAAKTGTTPTPSDPLTLSAHMKEDAGNEYQGLTLEGIAVTVYATQAPSEYDSFDNQYDAAAFDALADLYPVSASEPVNDSGDTVITKDTVTVTVPKAAVEEQASAITVTVEKKAEVDPNFVLSDSLNKLHQFDVKVTGIAAANTEPITVKLFIGKGYVFEGNQVAIQHLKADQTVEKLTGTYSDDGYVTFTTTSFSPFAVEVPDMDAVIPAGLDTTYYATMVNAIAAVPEKGETATTVTLLRDAVGGGLCTKDNHPKNLILNFNGHTYSVKNPGVGSTGTENQAMHWSKNSILLMKNGALKVLPGSDQIEFGMQNYSTFTAENMVFDFTEIPVGHYPDFTETYPSFAAYSNLEIPLFNNNNSVSMTLTDTTIIFPKESTKGIYNDSGVLTLNHSTIDGYVCVETVKAKVLKDSSSSWKGFVNYFEGYTPGSQEAENGYTAYFVTAE